MPKMKSNRRLMRGIKVTGSGKVKVYHSHTSHLSHNKTHKQIRHLRKATTMKNCDYKRIKDMIA